MTVSEKERKKDKTNYDKFVQMFSRSIRSDIKEVRHRKSKMTSRTAIAFELDGGWSIEVTNWSDGFGVIIYTPNCQVLVDKWPLSLEEAQKMVSEWRAK